MSYLLNAGRSARRQSLRVLHWKMNFGKVKLHPSAVFVVACRGSKDFSAKPLVCSYASALIWTSAELHPRP
jgi:hypothetical protein